jgi:pyridoxamine 5'-phosphate oxidase
MNHKNDFSENSIDTNPFVQFKSWYEEHLLCGIDIPDSMTLATAFADGRVSARTVLLKDYNDNGFVFYTNYKSKKGSQLSSNPRAALLFYWAESGRQVRIEGFTEKIPDKESESYFSTRPRESQLSALVSEQSTVIPDRKYLEDIYENYRNMYSGKPVDKPAHWGGYRLIPEWFEFWQNGEFRLHDRLSYSKRNHIWIIERLAP